MSLESSVRVGPRCRKSKEGPVIPIVVLFISVYLSSFLSFVSSVRSYVLRIIVKKFLRDVTTDLTRHLSSDIAIVTGQVKLLRADHVLARPATRRQVLVTLGFPNNQANPDSHKSIDTGLPCTTHVLKTISRVPTRRRREGASAF